MRACGAAVAWEVCPALVAGRPILLRWPTAAAAASPAGAASDRAGARASPAGEPEPRREPGGAGSKPSAAPRGAGPVGAGAARAPGEPKVALVQQPEAEEAQPRPTAPPVVWELPPPAASPRYDGRGTGLLYDPVMLRHRNLDDDCHPEQPLRIGRIYERLVDEGLAARCVRVPCRRAAREELAAKHTARYIDAMHVVQDLSEREASEEGSRYRSVYLCPESTQAALMSAGSVMEATARVCAGDVQNALCVVRPPGHHAECDCAMGFCLFGNVALAAAEAQRRGWARRVLIVDWDVHHGNGTQRMFDEDSAVLFFSAHRYDGGVFFPGGSLGHFTSHGVGEGVGYSLNVPWDVRGAAKRGVPSPGDAEYIDAFDRILLPVARTFAPELVLVSAGFDAAAGDPLGECRVTPAGYFQLTRRLLGLAGGRVVLALEGGYNLASISASMAACARALLGDDAPPPPAAEAAATAEPAAAAEAAVAAEAAAAKEAPPAPAEAEAQAEAGGRGEVGQCPPPPAHHFHTQGMEKVRQHLSQFWPCLLLPGEEVPGAAPAPEPRVPASALRGSLADMERALSEHAEAAGVSYERLQRRQESLLFKLEELPAPPAQVQQEGGWKALRSSFAKLNTEPPYLLPVVHVASPEQAVRNVGLAFQAGAQGAWLVNAGHAHSPPEAALERPEGGAGPGPSRPQPQRTSLKGPAGPTAKAGRAQLAALSDCFAGAREQFPDLWLGLCVPQLPAAQVFKWVAAHCPSADAAWLQELPCRPAEVAWQEGECPGAPIRAVRVEKWLTDGQPALKAVRRERQLTAAWPGLVFGTVAGSRQEWVHHQQESQGPNPACQALLRHWAALAGSVCDVLVTGGAAAGPAADPGDLRGDARGEPRPCPAAKLRAMAGATPIALHCAGCRRVGGGAGDGADGGDLGFVDEWDCAGSADLVLTDAAFGGDGDPLEFELPRLRAWVAQWRAAAGACGAAGGAAGGAVGGAVGACARARRGSQRELTSPERAI